MTTETNDQPEPIIWFEGTLISSPRQNRSAEDWLLETMAMGTATRKITIHASGREHSENIRDHARKGSRLMVKGTAGDEGSGIDIEATSLAFDPSHNEPDGMTTVTPLTSPKDAAQAAGDDAKAGTGPDSARITSRKTLYERFKTKLKANLDERKQ